MHILYCAAFFVLHVSLFQVPKTEADWLSIAEEIKTRCASFVHCIGALDGKHIAILPHPTLARSTTIINIISASSSWPLLIPTIASYMSTLAPMAAHLMGESSTTLSFLMHYRTSYTSHQPQSSMKQNTHVHMLSLWMMPLHLNPMPFAISL